MEYKLYFSKDDGYIKIYEINDSGIQYYVVTEDRDREFEDDRELDIYLLDTEAEFVGIDSD